MADEVKKKMGPLRALFTLAMAAAAVWYYLGGGLEQQAATTMNHIQTKVADDAVTQYQIAKRNGTAMDVCVQAGFVTAAFLQAKDEANYAKWKAVQRKDCKRAGVEQ